MISRPLRLEQGRVAVAKVEEGSIQNRTLWLGQ